MTLHRPIEMTETLIEILMVGMDEIQTHVTSLSGALGLSVAKHVILDLSQGQESFTMWLGFNLEKQGSCFKKFDKGNGYFYIQSKIIPLCRKLRAQRHKPKLLQLVLSTPFCFLKDIHKVQ